MFEAIIAAGERLSRTAGLRAIVLAGAGKGFCAGLDKESIRFTWREGRAGPGRSHETYAWDRQRLPAGGLCLAHASRSGHCGDPWGRARRRLSDRPWRRHPLCRAGRAPRDPGNQMGHCSRHGRNRAHARTRPLRRDPRARDDRAHFLRDGGVRLMVSPPASTPIRSPPLARPPRRSPPATRTRCAPSSACSTQRAIPMQRRSFSPNRKSRRRCSDRQIRSRRCARGWREGRDASRTEAGGALL